MSSSVGTRMATGVAVGTTSAINVPLDFEPRRVEIFNTTSGDHLVWIKEMGPDAGFKSVAAGAGAAITSGGITPNSKQYLDDAGTARGFTIGTDSDINDTDEVLVWTALE